MEIDDLLLFNEQVLRKHRNEERRILLLRDYLVSQRVSLDTLPLLLSYLRHEITLPVYRYPLIRMLLYLLAAFLFVVALLFRNHGLPAGFTVAAILAGYPLQALKPGVLCGFEKDVTATWVYSQR